VAAAGRDVEVHQLTTAVMQTVDDNRRTRSSSFDQLQPNGATPTPPLPLPPLLLLLQLKFGGVI